MAADRIDIDAVLDGWRAAGVDRVDPLHFHRVAALHRRAAVHAGAARQALEARLVALVQAYDQRMDGRIVACAGTDTDAADAGTSASAVFSAQDEAPSTRAHGAEHSALGALIEAMAVDAPTATGRAALRPPRAAYPELPALDEFRQLWSTLRTGSQVRRSLAPPTDDAGPLNSSRLVHRSLTLMRGLSPEYLQQFLAYADTLSWLETLQDAGVLTGKEATPTASGKPRAKAKPRKRKG